MTAATSKPPAAHWPPLPFVPFLLWSLAVLAYPAWLLAELAARPGVAATTLFALPTILVRGLLLLPIALLAAGVWALAIGAGMAVLRRAGYAALTTAERAVFGGGIGMGFLSLATFLLGTVSGGPQWLLSALLWALLLGMACLGGRELWRAIAAGANGLNAWRREASKASIAIVALGALIVFIALTRANVPVFADYDSLEYHLAAPAHWCREGRVTFIRDVVYTNFPQNTEMLFLLAMSCFGGPGMGALVGLHTCIGFTLLAAAAVAACGRRLDSAEAGRAGAALLLTAPFLAELATLNSYVTELPLAAYAFLSLQAFLLLRRAPSPGERWRYAILCGAMSGLAIGTKYPAAAFVLAPMLAFVLGCGVARPRSLPRSAASAAIVLASALVVAGPWLVRNAVNTGNPTYPLLQQVFGGWNWTPEQDAKFSAAHRSTDSRFVGIGRRFWTFALWREQPVPASPVLLLFALVPMALADRRSTRMILYGGTAFLLLAAAQRLAPDRLGALAPSMEVATAAFVLALVTAPAFLVLRGDVMFLPLHAVLWMLAWYTLTHRLDRFLDPVSPAVALLGGIGLAAIATRWTRPLARGVLVAGLCYTVVTTLLLFGPLLWVGLSEPHDSFLQNVFEGSTYCQPATDRINKLPEDARVLFVGESRTFYCRRRVFAATVFDRGPLDRLLEAGPPGDPARRVRDGLRALGVSHVYINWQEVHRLTNSYAYRFEGRVHQGLPQELYAGLVKEMMRAGWLHPVAVFGTDAQGRPRPDFVLYELR